MDANELNQLLATAKDFNQNNIEGNRTIALTGQENLPYILHDSYNDTYFVVKFSLPLGDYDIKNIGENSDSIILENTLNSNISAGCPSLDCLLG